MIDFVKYYRLSSQIKVLVFSEDQVSLLQWQLTCKAEQHWFPAFSLQR
jgi:hypothetical protein